MNWMLALRAACLAFVFGLWVMSMIRYAWHVFDSRSLGKGGYIDGMSCSFLLALEVFWLIYP